MSGFDDLADRLGDLQGIPSRIAGVVADRINDAIEHQFDNGCDPYGEPWAPLLPSTIRRKYGDARILRRSDLMSSTTRAHAMPSAGVELSSEPYGAFHQDGTVNMVARPIFPDGKEMPDEWQVAIDEETEDAFDGAMR